MNYLHDAVALALQASSRHKDEGDDDMEDHMDVERVADAQDEMKGLYPFELDLALVIREALE